MSDSSQQQIIQAIIKRLSTNLQLELPLAEFSDRIELAKEIQSLALAKGFAIPLYGCWNLLQALKTYRLEHFSKEEMVALAVLIIEQIEFDKRITVQR